MPSPDSPTALRVAAIAGRMRRLLNDGMLALLTGFGDRAGLLRALAESGPATAAAVARTTTLPPAAVQAWLGALVAGQIVEYDGARSTFGLPAGMAAFLNGGEGRALRARLAELCALAAGDAGTATGVAAEEALSLDELARLAPGLRARLAGGARVLELGCGTGALSCALAAAHPAGRCLGRDPRRTCIDAARRRARRWRLTNVEFVCGSALPVRREANYDAVISLDERLLASPVAVDRLSRVMAPGATALLAVPATTGWPSDDAVHPFGPYLLGARALSTGPAAPPSTELGPRLAAAGFRVSALARLPHDAFRNFLILEK